MKSPLRVVTGLLVLGLTMFLAVLGQVIRQNSTEPPPVVLAAERPTQTGAPADFTSIADVVATAYPAPVPVETATEAAGPIQDSAAATPSPTPPAGDLALTTATTRHVVQAGETLASIADQYAISVAALLEVNPLEEGQPLKPGQVLSLPTFTAWSPPATLSGVWPRPGTLNGVPITDIVYLSADALAQAREIFTLGQRLGRDRRRFAKLGDSTIESPFFLARFDSGPYKLGSYAFLQPVIDHFAGAYARESVAVRRGMHTWTAFDPWWADKEQCQAEEGPLPCEIRLTNPSILLIRLGANDAGTPESYERHLREIIDYALDLGIIPVIGTTADRFDGKDTTNEAIRRVVAEYHLPVWDYDRVAATLPDRGLGADGVHLTIYYAHDYTVPVAFQRGHAVHNLTALLVLDTIWRQVIAVEPCCNTE